MTGFQVTERLERPPEEVFALLTDVAAARRWAPQIERLELVTPGPLQEGSRLRETRRVMGRDVTAELEVERFDPPREYAVSNTTSGVRTTYWYRLTAESDGTRVALTCTIEARGLRRLTAPILRRVLERQDRDQLARLRAAALGG